MDWHGKVFYLPRYKFLSMDSLCLVWNSKMSDEVVLLVFRWLPKITLAR
jgi:hypothetical protein